MALKECTLPWEEIGGESFLEEGEWPRNTAILGREELDAVDGVIIVEGGLVVGSSGNHLMGISVSRRKAAGRGEDLRRNRHGA